jgi:hypothetical protein
MGRDEATLAAAKARNNAKSEAQAKAFEKGVPTARVVRLPNADHFVFTSNEGDVLREMKCFSGRKLARVGNRGQGENQNILNRRRRWRNAKGGVAAAEQSHWRGNETRTNCRTNNLRPNVTKRRTGWHR